MANQDAMGLIFSRNAFYRRMYHLALATFVLSIIAIFFLGGMLFYIVRTPFQPIYFATDEASRLLSVLPLDQPNMQERDALNWMVDGVEAAYTYDYVNYRAELQNAQKYFTAYGWRNYMNALEASNNLVALTERNMIITAKVIETPKILRQGVLGGAYTYRVEMPLLVTYQTYENGKSKRFSNALTVNLLVQRQHILQSFHGLGIMQMVVSAAAATDSQAPTMGSSPTQ